MAQLGYAHRKAPARVYLDPMRTPAARGVSRVPGRVFRALISMQETTMKRR